MPAQQASRKKTAGSLRAFFGPESEREAIARQFREFKPVIQEEEDYDWVAHARSQWRAFPVGERFFLVPEWLDDAAPQGRLD